MSVTERGWCQDSKKKGGVRQNHISVDAGAECYLGIFISFDLPSHSRGFQGGLTTLIRPRWKGKTSADRTHRGPCLKVNSFNLITVDFIAASQIDASGFECGCGHGCGCGCGCGRKGKRKRNGAKDPGQSFCGRTAETVGESLGCCVRIFRVR